MKKFFLLASSAVLITAAVCIKSISNLSNVEMMVASQVESLSNPEGPCDGAPSKCIHNSGCGKLSCDGSAVVKSGEAGNKVGETLSCSVEASEGYFACCYGTVSSSGDTTAYYARCYPVSCCN